jgi:hypothetical protein
MVDPSVALNPHSSLKNLDYKLHGSFTSQPITSQTPAFQSSIYSSKDFKRPRDIKFEEKQGMFSNKGREMALPEEGAAASIN